ncbi:hypothetical protein [Tabrizicola soli]|uniref:Uncharacterized protein n=1 Tax=Tabrizicola soli TaxID=2185115 RepID=A0ABV7DWF3_9RHOB|nr:hypothetical protein [Tabrizicola soli]
MHTLVERMLPADVLLKQGIYLQTCAHIELTLWQIVQIADGHEVGSAPDIEAYLQVKKHTPKLVAAAKKATKLIPARLGLRLAALVARTEAGLLNRNLAAHGAWFVQANSDKLHVAHYFTVPAPPGNQWHYIDRPVSRRQVDFAIEDCNLILLEAVAIRGELEGLLRERKNRPPSPTRMSTSAAALIVASFPEPGTEGGQPPHQMV